MAQHELFMQRCMELATLGIGDVAPNPLVGCVIVHNGNIIGEGYHRQFGQAHAEVNAIQSVKDHSLLRESTLYVNLEPCAHHGKTPPCSNLIIEKGIPRVVVSNSDPYKEVAGKGLLQMQKAGIEVITGISEAEGRWLNRRFFTYHEQKRPYIILKWAATRDGFLDHERTPGEKRGPLKISGPETDRIIHRWRAEEQAILVGKNTVILDNPSLTTRLWPGKNPLRLVIDPQLQIPAGLNIFADGQPTWIYNAFKEYCEDQVCYVRIDDPSEFPLEICRHLFHNDVQSVIVEGGGDTLQRFIEAGLWDEARIITGKERIGNGIPAPRLTGRLLESTGSGEDQIDIYLAR